MEVGSPEWIEASLAKLDELERQRGEHEAALESANDPLTLQKHNDALERLDAEIKTLYAQLEAVAGEDEDDDEDDEVDDVAAHVTQGDEERSAPHAAAPVAAAPVAAAPDEALLAPAPASDNPFGSPSASPGGGFGGGFDAAPTAYDDGDLKPKGGGSKWAFLGVVVVAGLGIGGYFAWKNVQAQKAKEQAKPEVGESITIEAAAVPKDTEEPNAAKGADATISPTADGLPTKGSGGGGGGGNSKKSDSKKTKPLELKGGDDPLSG